MPPKNSGMPANHAESPIDCPRACCKYVGNTRHLVCRSAVSRGKKTADSTELRHLEEAVRRGFGYPGSILHDRHLDPLHGHPEFERLERLERLIGKHEWLRRAAQAETRLREGRVGDAERLLIEVLDAIEQLHGDRTYGEGVFPLLQLAPLLQRVAIQRNSD